MKSDVLRLIEIRSHLISLFCEIVGLDSKEERNLDFEELEDDMASAMTRLETIIKAREKAEPTVDKCSQT